jgi:hypothetical protein
VIPERVRAATGDLVRKLKLPHKKRVSFYLRHVPDEDKQSLIHEFKKLAEGLGFKMSSITFR